MKLGYIAIGNQGTIHRLTDVHKSPRQQLLEKCERQRADKIYEDDRTTGDSYHTGYIVGGVWYNVYEVHQWKGN